ncbi:Hypothetical predicted protein [Prunus dulcis]|uniref:Uncharacterized protein n=1 Tax=Prunus dulcis TaxID=3755 RepID=A0A5E4G6U9_PRUDU|nr:Hypothetical predicted protein [Prunus dulcis]
MTVPTIRFTSSVLAINGSQQMRLFDFHSYGDLNPTQPSMIILNITDHYKGRTLKHFMTWVIIFTSTTPEMASGPMTRRAHSFKRNPNTSANNGSSHGNSNSNNSSGNVGGVVHGESLLGKAIHGSKW